MELVVSVISMVAGGFNTGGCVKQSGSEAVHADCSQPGTYRIVKRTTDEGGDARVLCLTAAH